jgi:hypothetical protein
LQSFADLVGIIEFGDSFVEKLRDASSDGFSSLSSSLWAAGSNSIVRFGVKAIAAHYFFEWDGTNAPGANLCETLLGEVDVFQFFEMLKDCFAGVVSLGAAGTLGEPVETLFDFVGKTNS